MKPFSHLTYNVRKNDDMNICEGGHVRKKRRQNTERGTKIIFRKINFRKNRGSIASY